MKRKILAALTAALMVGGITIGTASAASAAPKSKPTAATASCQVAGYEAPVNVSGKPQALTVTAPAGKFIDSYCVVSGNLAQVITVWSVGSSVVIDPFGSNSITQYQLHLIDAVQPPQPEPVFEQVITETLDCEAGVLSTTEVNYLTQYWWDAGLWQWRPYVEREELVNSRPVIEGECP
jgi:hypothetical protein